MAWTLVAKDTGYGHKLYTDEHGRVAIADQSGQYPDQTDDGILWVDPVAQITIDGRGDNDAGDHHGLGVGLTVEDKDGAVSQVLISNTLAVCLALHWQVPLVYRTGLHSLRMTPLDLDAEVAQLPHSEVLTH